MLADFTYARNVLGRVGLLLVSFLYSLNNLHTLHKKSCNFETNDIPRSFIFVRLFRYVSRTPEVWLRSFGTLCTSTILNFVTVMYCVISMSRWQLTLFTPSVPVKRHRYPTFYTKCGCQLPPISSVLHQVCLLSVPMTSLFLIIFGNTIKRNTIFKREICGR